MIKQLIKKTQLVVAALTVGIFAAATPASIAAAGNTNAGQSSSDPCAPAAIVAFPHWYDNGLCKDGKIVSPNDVGGIPKFVTILATNIVTIILMVVGYVSLAFIIWGGFKYMYSGDNASGTTAAKKTILNAVIGLVLSIMSVAIVKVVAGAIA
jgi:hypothetical protein